jgi:hypothetical protein
MRLSIGRIDDTHGSSTRSVLGDHIAEMVDEPLVGRLTPGTTIRHRESDRVREYPDVPDCRGALTCQVGVPEYEGVRDEAVPSGGRFRSRCRRAGASGVDEACDEMTRFARPCDGELVRDPADASLDTKTCSCGAQPTAGLARR